MSKYIYLLDPGHGGMINGEYVTEGKRSPVWEDGSQYFEGVGNRQIVSKLSRRLRQKGIDARDIVCSEHDMPLAVRTRIENDIYRRSGGRTIYISIHSDAWTEESANGYSVYTYHGQSPSDEIAEVFLNNMEKGFPRRKMRVDPRDGDKDKEANFQVLRETLGRAILIENFFMTNESECREILLTEGGQDKIVDCHFNSIMEIECNDNI